MKFKVGTQEFEIKDADLAKGLEDKTSVMTLVEDVIVRTQEEEEKFVENRKKEARKEGVEIAVKKYREETGLEFEGKNIEALVKAANAKTLEEAKLNPDEAVKKANEKVLEKDKALKLALKRAEDAEGLAAKTKAEYRIDKLLDAAIPENTVLPKEDVKLILKSKLEFKENEDGVMEVIDLSTGKTIKNPQTTDALPMKDAVEDFFRTNTHYVKPVSGGGAGGDSGSGGGTGKMSIETFNKNMSEKDIAINTPAYETALNEAIAAKQIDLEA